MVSALKLRNTKKGDRYGSFNLEDKTGFLEIIAWPDTYKKCAELLSADDPIFVKGRLEAGEERMQVIANEISLLAEAAKGRANSNGFGNDRQTVRNSTCMRTKAKSPSTSWCACAICCSNIPAPARFSPSFAASLSETVIELARPGARGRHRRSWKHRWKNFSARG